MSITFTGGDEVATTIARLRALADDLERMTMFQPNRELSDVPELQHWAWDSRRRPCLIGFVSDHPSLPDGPGMTSEVYAIDRQLGWVRTFSRFYRLGPALTLPKDNQHD